MSSQCIFVEDIPDDAMKILFYVDKQNVEHRFEDMKYLYFYNEETDEDVFYCSINEYDYRILHVNVNIKGDKFIYTQDTNNQLVYMYLNRFKYQHTLIL